MQAQASSACASTGRPSRAPPCRTPEEEERKHDIDVVIDRLKLRRDLHDGLRQRWRRASARRTAHRRRAALALEIDTGARAPVQQPLRLPGVQLFARRDGTAAVLVQLTGRRLPDLRRPGRGHRLRPRPRGRVPDLSLASGAVKGWDQLATPTPSRCSSGPALRLRHRRAVRALPEQARQVLLRGSGATRSRSSTRPRVRRARKRSAAR